MRATAAVLLTCCLALSAGRCVTAAEVPFDESRGLYVVVGTLNPTEVADLARWVTGPTGGTVYVQTSDAADVQRLSEVFEKAGVLGSRVFVAQGAHTRIHLADNLADRVIVPRTPETPEAEALRVLRPGGKAKFLAGGDRTVVKPLPEGTDAWSHPYHDPSNNPQSADRLARSPFMTQYLARPVFGCTPTVTVAAGGRLFRAYGHIAFTTRQNDVLETLHATNAHNGTLLWTRKLSPGFMIHRNTLIATPDVLYLADDKSCKLIDPRTGEVTGEIVPPVEVAGGTVWKWMALAEGRLYALTGGEEVNARRQQGRSDRFGSWGWAVWPGYDYGGGERAWGFGRDFLAIDPATKQVLWHHRETDLVDSRGVCMRDGRIYLYSPGKSLACISAADGNEIWRTSDAKLLAAIGGDARAQNPQTGFTTSAYIKCNDRFLFFAGPQRPRLVAVSAADGRFLWQFPRDGNFQLVLRDDALYAAGQGSLKFAYDDGKVLAKFRNRHNCTRATGSVDSVFFRGPNGTSRYIPATGAEEHIAPMRPPCQDGVVIADGLLHWGPWICSCRNSLWGDICLASAGDFDFSRKADESLQLGSAAGDVTKVAALDPAPGDWPAFRHDSRRSAVTDASVPAAVRLAWTWKPDSTLTVTAPVIAGGRVFFGDALGTVRALDVEAGKVVTTVRTEGEIYYPPSIWNGRAYVGSHDGHVYCFEAATGRLLWRFRVAPVDRRIPVFGKIISTWPVAGGVAVADGVVYAAGGIAHFDGTHVAALDAVTGKIRWHNNASGVLNDALQNGISLMGNLSLADGRLEFPGGNVYPVASYDAATGKCLNKVGDARGLRRDLFYPRDQWDLQHSVVATISLVAPSGVLAIPAAGQRKVVYSPSAEAAGVGNRKWESPFMGNARALVSTANAALLLTERGGGSTLRALRLTDGAPMWSHEFPAAAVAWGLAVDGRGRCIVSCEDGQMFCLAPKAPE